MNRDDISYYKEKAQDHIKAHQYATSNRKQLEESDLCGCFYCLETYNPTEITDWVEDKGGDTAICPKCSIDSVLPSKSGFPLEKDFLEKMKDHWF